MITLGKKLSCAKREQASLEASPQTLFYFIFSQTLFNLAVDLSGGNHFFPFYRWKRIMTQFTKNFRTGKDLDLNSSSANCVSV